LDLSKNHLTTVPDTLACQHKLTTLDLSRNRLTTVNPARLRRRRINDLMEQWDLVTQKLSRLEKEKILAVQVDEKFRIERQIEEVKVEQARIEKQLRELEG